MGTGDHNAGGSPCDGLASHPGGGGGNLAIFLVALGYRNQNKVQASWATWLTVTLVLSFIIIYKNTLL